VAIQVVLPDGKAREFERGTTVAQVAASIGPGLLKNAVAGKIDGYTVDLSRPIERDCRVEVVTLDGKDGLDVYRHSTAHLMAQAIKRIYGKTAVKLGIGPVIEDGRAEAKLAVRNDSARLPDAGKIRSVLYRRR